jgi:hypothetical protein
MKVAGKLRRSCRRRLQIVKAHHSWLPESGSFRRRRKDAAQHINSRAVVIEHEHTGLTRQNEPTVRALVAAPAVGENYCF